MRQLLILAFSIIGAQAVGQETQGLDLIYSQQLDAFDYGNGNSGFYGQDWFSTVIGSQYEGRKTVYVEGRGKLGDFVGVLTIDCVDASRSEWVATGGFLRPDTIPPEAIAGIRRNAC